MTTRAESPAWWEGFRLGRQDAEAGTYRNIWGDSQAAADKADGYAAGRGLAVAHQADREAGE
jgi:hypothetical protein